MREVSLFTIFSVAKADLAVIFREFRIENFVESNIVAKEDIFRSVVLRLAILVEDSIANFSGRILEDCAREFVD